ncbi:hypothetical protein CY35_02G043600 [Sphagnum magellanicum]|nr:hypothetical protein CY35_02G043600 [Sphagnum magellanicum]KAH9570507.1 hypothetical protein CY35_02G043600 [Sphagnum magellanicum]KAH9570508.1 hypothetical protein CY35_02G043600 [Sphagnum magellanicum]
MTIPNLQKNAENNRKVPVPMEVLFAPQKEQARLSSDGQFLAYLGPSAAEVSNVWVRPINGTEEEAKMVTEETHRGIHWYIWNPSSEYIIYKQDNGGDENFHHYAVELATGEIRDLTPYDNVHSKIIPSSISGLHPYDICICMNICNKTDFDVYKVNIRTGEAVLDTQNPGDVSDWLCDSLFQIRGALHYDLSDGSSTIRVRDAIDAPWREVCQWSSEDQGSMVGFAANPGQMYILSSLNSETTQLLLINTADGSVEQVIASSPKSDLMPFKFDLSKVLLMDFRTKEYVAVAFCYGTLKWTALHSSVEGDIELLTNFKDGQMTIGSRDCSNQKWVVTYEKDNASSESYLYDRECKTLSLLFLHHPKLKEYELGNTYPHTVKSRDDLDILVYLTLPPGVKAQNLPMVLRIHGGPWYRDWWGFDSENQFWATRGYACLQVEYRGSDGFGKKFLHAGDKQWGAAMQNDITDSVLWAINEGYADRDRVAITGISFGGYCTLAGITFTPELYKCAADLVGPSQLFTVTTKIVSYWKPRRKILNDRVVDLTKDHQLNQTQSPIFHVDNIRVPLIMAHGKNDVVVNPGESERMFQALKDNGKAVQYVIYKDEGHFLERLQNKMDWYQRVENLFHEILGGQVGPPPPVQNSGAILVADLISKHQPAAPVEPILVK